MNQPKRWLSSNNFPIENCHIHFGDIINHLSLHSFIWNHYTSNYSYQSKILVHIPSTSLSASWYGNFNTLHRTSIIKTLHINLILQCDYFVCLFYFTIVYRKLYNTRLICHFAQLYRHQYFPSLFSFAF